MVTLRRAQMILLSAQGMPVTKIVEVTFTSADRVRDVIYNFNAEGFDSLYPKYSGGRPKTFTLSERREIKKIAKSKPAEHGLPFSPGVWPSWPTSWSPRGAWRQPSSPGVPELRSGQGRRLRRGASASCLDPVDDAGYLVDEADVTFWGLCPAVPSGGRLTVRARSPARPLLDRDPLDVAREADDVEILRTEDVQVGRAGRPGRHDQTRSNRSRFITLFHAATKSCTNFSRASSLA